MKFGYTGKQIYMTNFQDKQAGWTTSHSNHLGPLGLRKKNVVCPWDHWVLLSHVVTHSAVAGRQMSKEFWRGLSDLALIENTLNSQRETSYFGCCRNAVSKPVMLCCPLLDKSWNPYIEERPVKICVDCAPTLL